MIDQNDTIVAIATPIGIGGLSVIRVSGKNAIDIVDKIFKGNEPLIQVKTFTAHYGRIYDTEEKLIDEVVVTVFREPHSYTAENMVEISCHGGAYISRILLETLIDSGARMAAPGEFTKRAFLNGRIDLAQAEAVAEVIRANSELAHHSSIQQLEGRLSKEVNLIRDKLLNLCSILEAELEFIEEDIEIADKKSIKSEIESIIVKLKVMIRSYQLGRVYRDGIKMVIVGKTNVGKSSILNTLLNENRAIVTEIPGTTRDTIEESITLGGILFKIIDTAGVRISTDPVEMEGIFRTKKQIEGADIITFVLDPTQGFTNEDYELFEIVKELQKLRNIIVVINKVDISNPLEEFLIFSKKLSIQPILISAKTSSGFGEFKNSMQSSVSILSRDFNERSVIITNERHKEVLRKAVHSLANALKSIKNNISNEFIVLDVRLASDYLSEIIGIISTDDLLNNIFKRFCIGK